MKRVLLTILIPLTFAACDKTKVEAPEGSVDDNQVAEQTVEEEAVLEEAKPKPAAALADDLKTGEQGFYGERFTVIEEPISLASALNEPTEATIKVEATVQTVCKKKGCWFTMGGEGVDDEVRVRMKDYAFFVPRNSEKAHVVAEGTLKQRELSQEEAQHYADDAAEAGETPEKVDAARTVWEFTATAIELRAEG